jgi:hypothetical protein
MNKTHIVVPAKAGTHMPEAVVMGPRYGVPATLASRGAPRGDDNACVGDQMRYNALSLLAEH